MDKWYEAGICRPTHTRRAGVIAKQQQHQFGNTARNIKGILGLYDIQAIAA